MFKKLKSIFNKSKAKAKDFFGKAKSKFGGKKGKAAAAGAAIDIGIKEPKVKAPEPPKKPEEPKKPEIDGGIIEREVGKVKQFYLNMLSAYDENDFPDGLLAKAKMKILASSEDELDNLMDMLGDNGFSDWKEHYEDLRLSKLTDDILADMEAKLQQIIEILG